MEELQQFLSAPRPITKFARPFVVRTDYDIYMCGEILGPEHYIEDFDLIRNAQEDDLITLHLNTPGGRIDTALQFMRVMTESQATIVSSIEGACMSAGTILFLKADEFIISPHSMIQCHNYSGGMMGKGHEMHAQIMFEQPWSIKLMTDVYDQFLTQDEINNLIQGKDFWLNAEETEIRCRKLIEYRQALYDLEQEEAAEAQD